MNHQKNLFILYTIAFFLIFSSFVLTKSTSSATEDIRALQTISEQTAHTYFVEYRKNTVVCKGSEKQETFFEINKDQLDDLVGAYANIEAEVDQNKFSKTVRVYCATVNKATRLMVVGLDNSPTKAELTSSNLNPNKSIIQLVSSNLPCPKACDINSLNTSRIFKGQFQGQNECY